MPALELYPFRYRDPLTGKWIRARHKPQDIHNRMPVILGKDEEDE